MSRRQLQLDGMGLSLQELVDHSIELLREHEPEGGYHGAFSGGKDSIVIKHLAKMAGVQARWVYNVTTIDPPELIWYMRKHHSDVAWSHSGYGNFFRYMETKKGFPTRRARWCCERYKERSRAVGDSMIFGIRAEESSRRSKAWSEVAWHKTTRRPAILPIFHWPSEELWEFIRGEGLDYCSLYDEGFHRLGCIGCPMARESGRIMEFERWPKFEKRWQLSFKRIWARRTGMMQRDGRPWFGDRFFKNWQQMWDWWLHDRPLPK